MRCASSDAKSNRDPDELKAAEPDVDWPGLASLGNVLRHEYQRLDPVLVWTLLTDELEPLIGAVGRMEASTQHDG